MFSHVMVGVSDLEASRTFYDALLGTLGIGPGVANKARYFYRSPTGTFGITIPINGEPATHANGGTLVPIALARVIRCSQLNIPNNIALQIF